MGRFGQLGFALFVAIVDAGLAAVVAYFLIPPAKNSALIQAIVAIGAGIVGGAFTLRRLQRSERAAQPRNQTDK